MEQLDDMQFPAKNITVRINQKTARVLSYATQKWTHLVDPIDGVNKSALVNEVLWDWYQWDNVYWGKTALVIFHVWRMEKLLTWFIGKLVKRFFADDAETLREFTEFSESYDFEIWHAEYKAGKENYNLVSEE